MPEKMKQKGLEPTGRHQTRIRISLAPKSMLLNALWHIQHKPEIAISKYFSQQVHKPLKIILIFNNYINLKIASLMLC